MFRVPFPDREPTTGKYVLNLIKPSRDRRREGKLLGVPTMNNSSLEFSPLNWLSLVPGLNRRFALKYITVENTNFKGNVIMIQAL